MRRVEELRLAFLLLTRVPVGQIRGDVPTMAASSWSWPIVGVFVGAISALAFLAGQRLGLPDTMSAILALASSALVTGAMHEDALADLADGFGGGRDRARKLEIMRDSRIGAYGVTALCLALLFRTFGIAAVAGSGAQGLAFLGLAAMTRAVQPAAMVLMPAARADGLGHAARGASLAPATVALALGLCALIPLGPVAGAGAALAVALGAGGVALLAMRQIGGQTGDVLGAMQMLGECAGWAALILLT